MYNPEPETAEWLDWAFERIQTLEYKPTARWVFYRLVQEKGFAKDDYKKFLGITSKARKGDYKDWTPETFADDTREIMGALGTGFTNPFKWLEAMALKRPKLEIGWHQKELVIVCFEAKAMVGQFKHLLERERIPLCPFGGDASIPFKFQIAEMVNECEQFSTEKDKPIVILYFGDYDQKGLEIPENAMRDIESWVDRDFKFCDSHEEVEDDMVNYIRCGINTEHIAKYQIPDRPDDPGKYQWEALDENAAREIILEAVDLHWSREIARKLRRAEAEVGEVWKDSCAEAIEEAKGRLGDLGLEFPETDEVEEEEDD